MSAIAIIPARGGSRRLPRKNIRLLAGKPIITYSIKVALESGLFADIIVSTDDTEIGHVALDAGAQVHIRDGRFARNEVGTQEVTAEVLRGYERANDVEHVCCIYATAPLVLTGDLVEGYRLVAGLYSRRLFALAVGAEPLRDAGAFYWSEAGALLAGKPLLGPTTGLVVLPEDRVCDVNDIADFSRCEELYARLRESLHG